MNEVDFVVPRTPDFSAELPEGWSWQYCKDGHDISGDFYAEQDADEVRLWIEDGTIMGCWERTRRGNWRSVPC